MNNKSDNSVLYPVTYLFGNCLLYKNRCFLFLFSQLKARMIWNYQAAEIHTAGDITFYYDYSTKQFTSVIFVDSHLKLLTDYEKDTLRQNWYNMATGELCAKILYLRQENNEILTFQRLKKLEASVPI